MNYCAIDFFKYNLEFFSLFLNVLLKKSHIGYPVLSQGNEGSITSRKIAPINFNKNFTVENNYSQ